MYCFLNSICGQRLRGNVAKYLSVVGEKMLWHFQHELYDTLFIPAYILYVINAFFKIVDWLHLLWCQKTKASF